MEEGLRPIREKEEVEKLSEKIGINREKKEEKEKWKRREGKEGEKGKTIEERRK